MHGENISVTQIIHSKTNFPSKKLVCITTSAMTGNKDGLVGKNEWERGPYVYGFHCIIHRNVLPGKIKDWSTFQTIASIASFIYARGKYIHSSFLLSTDTKYEYLPYYDEISGYPSTRCSKGFVIWKVKLHFLEIEQQNVSNTGTMKWQQDMAFWVHITEHINA